VGARLAVGDRMIDPERYFIHQWNSDHTIDSICSVCGLTACTEPTLSRAQEGEEQHQCPDWALGLVRFDAKRIATPIGKPVTGTYPAKR
jgi:hypothetical protein